MGFKKFKRVRLNLTDVSFVKLKFHSLQTKEQCFYILQKVNDLWKINSNKNMQTNHLFCIQTTKLLKKSTRQAPIMETTSKKDLTK